MPTSNSDSDTWLDRQSRRGGPIVALYLTFGLILVCSFDCSFDRFVALLTAVQWQHSGPFIALIIILIFYTDITEVLRRMRKFGFNSASIILDGLISEGQQHSPIATGALPGRTIITIDDVIELFPQVPHLNIARIVEQAPVAHSWLLRNGITTRDLLERFVKSRAVFESLAEIYITELRRSNELPLDPIAVSTWGVAIFLNGPNEATISRVIDGVRQSLEYKNAHGR